MPAEPRRAGPLLAALVSAAIAAVLAMADAGAASAAVTQGRVGGARCAPLATVASWPTARLAAAAVVVPVDVGSVASVGGEVAAGVGGVILTGSDAPTDLAAQVAALLRRAPGGAAPWVMVDEEGGSVQRLLRLTGSVPSARSMAATMTPRAIEGLAAGLGRKLRSLGVTMDLAPVLDLDAGTGPNSTDADGTRSFSADAATATADGIAFAEGLLSSGVAPVLKHFPGLGGATGNTDLRPAATRPYTGPATLGLQPFSAAVQAGLPAVMVANASVPGLTTAPASVSRPVIDGLLRDRLGFSGLVLTDSLSVPSVSKSGFSLPAAAVAALEAGADEVLYNALPSSTAADAAAIESAIGRAVSTGALSRPRLIQSARRALAAKERVLSC